MEIIEIAQTEQIRDGQMMVLVPQPQWKMIVAKMDSLIEKFEKINPDNGFKESEFIGINEVMKRFNLSRSFFDNLRRTGAIPTYKMNGKVYVRPTELKEVFLSKRE